MFNDQNCPTCGRSRVRSLPQNSRLHTLFTLMEENLTAKDGLKHSKEWWKVMSKDRWLGYREFRRSNGDLIQVLKSTSECSVDELSEFMNHVEEYCRDRGIA